MTETPYLVLARKWRPENFAQMIGQPALTRTLTAALTSGRIAPAYLLTGVRGTGKTSAARILARALNCETGITATPCGACAQCRAIATGQHLDVLEMDAASRTGVDDVRQIIDGISYAPTMGRRKLYIVDEAHMLSKSAWNALLKTLEEPPPHAHFVFCTTEARKIPMTILSRCQRFDLRRVETVELASHYETIAKAEGVTLDAEALQLIARAADGSVRDGLSILEQAIAVAGGKALKGADLRGLLGLAERGRALAVAAAAFAGDAGKTLAAFRDALQAGVDPALLLRDLLELAHLTAVAASAPGSLKALELSKEESALAEASGKTLGAAKAQGIWQSLLQGLVDSEKAPVATQAAEIALLKIAGLAA